MSLISELKRRNVLRVAAAYVVSSWLIIQVVETILPVYGVPDAVIRYVISALAVGLVPVVVLAWAFELTPEGLRRDAGAGDTSAAASRVTRNFDRAIIAVLAVAIAYFAFDKFVLSADREAAIVEAAREEGRTEALLGEFGDRSIAVLAFDDMSPDGDQEYMSDGIAEEILNLLARVPDLRVISRSSAFAFKGKDLPIPRIAEQLNAAFILEGSVRKAGDQIRITAQLIEAGTDTHRWSETYDRKLENVFDIQDEIAAHVVEELQSRLLGSAPRSTRLDEDAYTLVLQARYLWYRRAEGDDRRALELYQAAIELDDHYAPAWAGLSVAYAVAAYRGYMDREQALALAREAVDKALEIDPDYAHGWVRLGQARGRERDWRGSAAALEKAYELAPGDPLILGALALLASKQGRVDEMVRFSDAAAAVDPLGAIWPGNKGHWLANFGRLDEAEAAIRRSFELNGNRTSFDNNMATVHLLRGDYEMALEALDSLEAGGFNGARRVMALEGLGRGHEAAPLFEQLLAEEGREAEFGIAMIHAMRGDADAAFEQLQEIEGIPPWFIVYDGYIRRLRDDPRWKPYVDSLDWPWEYEY